MSSAGVVEKIHKFLAFVVNIGYSIARHDGPSWLGYAKSDQYGQSFVHPLLVLTFGCEANVQGHLLLRGGCQ